MGAVGVVEILPGRAYTRLQNRRNGTSGREPHSWPVYGGVSGTTKKSGTTVDRCAGASLEVGGSLPTRSTPYHPKRPIRIVTAASLFDGHDAAINVMRRILQASGRSEEHTSELQSRENLVCRLLLEKKKQTHPQRKTGRL